ncbi:hypothetical protein OSTOST_15814 [Ostertagia ostertagi]
MENVVVRYNFNCDGELIGIPEKYSSLDVTRVMLTVDKNNGSPFTFTQPYVIEAGGKKLEAISVGTYYSFYELPTANVTYIQVVSPTSGLICSLRAFVGSDSTMLLSYTDNSAIDIGSAVRYKGVPQLTTGLPIGFPAPTVIQMQPIDPSDGMPLGAVLFDSTFSSSTVIKWRPVCYPVTVHYSACQHTHSAVYSASCLVARKSSRQGN